MFTFSCLKRQLAMISSDPAAVSLHFLLTNISPYWYLILCHYSIFLFFWGIFLAYDKCYEMDGSLCSWRHRKHIWLRKVPTSRRILHKQQCCLLWKLITWMGWALQWEIQTCRTPKAALWNDCEHSHTFSMANKSIFICVSTCYSKKWKLHGNFKIYFTY